MSKRKGIGSLNGKSKPSKEKQIAKLEACIRKFGDFDGKRTLRLNELKRG